MTSRHVAALAVIAAVVSVRLVWLDVLPGEIYNDIVMLFEYAGSIAAGKWPAAFDQSNGPAYNYVVYPIFRVFGGTYLAFKLASVVLSLGTLVMLYRLMREVGESVGVALLAVLIAGSGSWLLVFSRLGNNQILIALLSVASTALAVRAATAGSHVALGGAAVLSAAAVYTLPQGFVIPVCTAIVYAVLSRSWRRVAAFVLICGLAILPAAALFSAASGANLRWYIGEKWPTGSVVETVTTNLGRFALSLHVRGDQVFRSNPAKAPHLDPVSGVLLILGVVYWLAPGRRRFAIVLFLPALLLQLPSVAVRYVDQVPSASRTLGAAPFVYALVASGLLLVWNRLEHVRALRIAVPALLLIAVLGLNVYRYFGPYAAGLPNHNTPFARLLAEYAAVLPPDRTVALVDCCWGEWGQPEPKGIRYSLPRPRPIHALKMETVCAELASLPHPVTVLMRPPEAGGSLPECLAGGDIIVRTVNSQQPFATLEVQ